MSTQTPPAATPATADRSTELVNRLLKLPDEVKLDLARLLTDSVREGFNSLEESEKKQKELIRSRLDQLVSGKVELLDADDMVAELEQRLVRRYHQELLGKPLSVLVEARPASRPGYVLGTACRYVAVELPGSVDDVGKLIEVQVDKLLDVGVSASRREPAACRR